MAIKNVIMRINQIVSRKRANIKNVCEKSVKSAAHPISPNEVGWAWGKKPSCQRQFTTLAEFCSLHLVDATLLLVLHLTDAIDVIGPAAPSLLTQLRDSINKFPLSSLYLLPDFMKLADKLPWKTLWTTSVGNSVEEERTGAWNNVDEAEISMNY